MNPKLLSLEQLAAMATAWKRAQRKVVATNGCFDILHVGHVRYLAAARALGDLLIVGVNGDDSVRALKGDQRPVNRAEDRAEVLAALAAVDYVTIFPDILATNFLRVVQPAIYVKGGDYRADSLNAEESALLEKLGTRIEIIPFEPGYSTSELLTRIQRR